MERRCSNCKYNKNSLAHEPCVSCTGNRVNFEPKHETGEVNSNNTDQNEHIPVEIKIDIPEINKIAESVKADMVNYPIHYTNSKIECIEVIEEITKPLEGFESYLTGTILKYLWRWKLKNGVEDLKKARWYLNKLIEKLEGEGKSDEEDRM